MLKNKKEILSYLQMDEPQEHYAKQNRPVTKEQILIFFHSYKISKVAKIIETGRW